MTTVETDNTAQGRLAMNILHFCRTLRQAGMPVGPGAVVDSLAAVVTTGIRRRDDFHAALRAILVRSPGEFRIFDQAFHVYFSDPRLLNRLMSLPALPRDAAGLPVERVIHQLMASLQADPESDTGEKRSDSDRSGQHSAWEVLRHKDFEQMNAVELAESRFMLRESVHPARKIRTRRFRSSGSGSRYDLRRSMRIMWRNDGELIELALRRRQERPPSLVLLCDISGSMSRYSRMFLQYAHALSRRYPVVHVFVFGTRLTNISRLLRDCDADRALGKVVGGVPDWDGGTRIADCLQTFNFEWSRRVLAGGASVVLLSDGLERDSGSRLSGQMQRLRHSCRELIWMNPMLRYEAFEPRASGIRAMLPHVSRFVPAHNVASVTALAQMLARSSRMRTVRREGRAA
jgi:uncharacterized protein with von Willebrand factor type A (vWA) domain